MCCPGSETETLKFKLGQSHWNSACLIEQEVLDGGSSQEGQGQEDTAVLYFLHICAHF